MLVQSVELLEGCVVRDNRGNAKTLKKGEVVRCSLGDDVIREMTIGRVWLAKTSGHICINGLRVKPGQETAYRTYRVNGLHVI